MIASISSSDYPALVNNNHINLTLLMNYLSKRIISEVWEMLASMVKPNSCLNHSRARDIEAILLE